MNEVLEELVIALAAAAVFLGDIADIGLQALALQEHEEAMGLRVGRWDGQGAGGAGELVSGGIELEISIHGEKVAGSGGYV